MRRTLGVGSFGRVQLVYHLPSSTFYAMKRLKKSEIIKQKQVEHTNNERALLTKTTWAQIEGTPEGSNGHPFLVKTICSFQDPHFLYIVMEYVNGGELFSLLRKVKTLPPFVAQFYAAEVVLAFEFLHSNGVIYRDLKPENMVIAKDGHIRIIDFGFARVLGDGAITYTLCGTPDYLAPEILRQQGYGFGVDWWALGVLIYEMLTGCPPFYESSHLKLYDKIRFAEPHYPSSLDSLAKDIISKLLSKDPYRRLGCSHRGAEEIKHHPWFKEVRWDTLLGLRVRPPYKPKVANDGDESNFDTYPEEPAEASRMEPAVENSFFPEF